MKAFLQFFAAIALFLLPALALAQEDPYRSTTFIDKAIWFIVPALALVVIVLMIRNRRQIANRSEEEE